MWKVREFADKVTNVVMNYTEIEAKVREATNDDPWGPTGTLRHELAHATFSYDQFPEVMGMLWKRIAENKRSPRRIYKSLLLVHHLLLNGSDRVIRATTDRLYEIRQLQDYHVVYEPGFNIASIIPVDEYKDGETNVRVKAKEIVELVQDEERLRSERKKAKKNRDKYVGIGSERSASKWNDFDDDLQFPRSSNSSKYDDFDGEEDKDSIGIRSSKSTNSKESPKAVNIKLKSKANDEEDFNSYTSEKSSKSAHSDSTAANTSGGDFADFKSAFGGSENGGGATNFANHNSSTNTSSAIQHDGTDLFASMEQSQAHHAHNNVDLLGLDISPSILPPAQTQPVIGSNTSTLSSSFDAFQGFQTSFSPPVSQGVSQGSIFNLGGGTAGLQNFQSAQQQPMIQQPNFQPQQMSHQQQQQHILFGDTNEGDHTGFGLLQPLQANNNINNNHVGGGSEVKPGAANKTTLVGTTWSDLNISIDDLSLSSKPKPNVQPTMNQLLSSPSRSNSKPF